MQSMMCMSIIKDSIFHIGVGSNVVCSTAIGDARALVRGTDNNGSTLEPLMIVYKPNTQIKYEVLSVN